jgi:hypothetical protein
MKLDYPYRIINPYVGEFWRQSFAGELPLEFKSKRAARSYLKKELKRVAKNGCEIGTDEAVVCELRLHP